MPKRGRRLVCPACSRTVGVNRSGNVARHLPPGSGTFDRACPGSGGPGEPAPPALFAQGDIDPIIAALRDRRETLGLMQQDVAAVAGCHPQHYGQIERGATSPQFRTLRAILAAVGADLILHIGDGQEPTEAGLAARVVQLETDLANVRTQRDTTTSKSLTELRQRVDRLAADNNQLHARAVTAETTVTEVREQNRLLRKDVTRITESRDRVRREAAESVTAMRVERDQATAEQRRAQSALDALARQPVITHDLVDRARTVVAGRAA